MRSARIACCTLTSPSMTTSASAIAPSCTRAACSAPTASDSCADANGYQKFPQIGRVEIGDDVEIGANSCVDRAALGVTRIGDGVKLDNMVHIGHNCSIGKHVVIAAQTGSAGGVVVEDYAVIGGQVGIGDKARIETGAVLGSGCGFSLQRSSGKASGMGNSGASAQRTPGAACESGAIAEAAQAGGRDGKALRGKRPNRKTVDYSGAGRSRAPLARDAHRTLQNRIGVRHQALQLRHVLPRFQLPGRQRHLQIVSDRLDGTQRLA